MREDTLSELDAAPFLVAYAGPECFCFTGEQLGQEPGLPVHLYGHVCPQQRSLAELRRSLGYFRSTAAGTVQLPVPWHRTTPLWRGKQSD